MPNVRFPEVRLFSVVKMSVCTACVGVGVCTALFGFTQLSSITEGFKLCWRSGRKAHLETIPFGRSNPPSHSFSFFDLFYYTCFVSTFYQLWCTCGVVYRCILYLYQIFFSTKKDEEKQLFMLISLNL